MAAARQVLLIGFDPRTVPGVGAEVVEMAIAIGRARLEEQGYEADELLVSLEESATDEPFVRSLTAKPYACVVVGGGIRKPPEMLELFERVVNLVRLHAPQATIAFNTNPTDSADAATRSLGIVQSRVNEIGLG